MGWPIYGRHWEELTSLYARPIGVIGDFKEGKTYVISLLAGRSLPDDATKHTPGICLTLPEDYFKNKPQMPSTTEIITTPSTPTSTTSAKKLAGGRVVKKAAGSNSSVNAAPAVGTVDLVQGCYIDTEGTDQPCSDDKQEDIRATQFLIRTLVLETASRVVFVTRKWGFATQTKVKDIIIQLNTSNESSHHITFQQKLIVVHNHPDAMDRKGLNDWIEEVRDSYDNPDNKLDDNVKRWMVEATSDGKEHFYTSYNNILHYFLMNNKCEEGKKYNDSIIDDIRAALRQGAATRIDFIQKIMQSATTNLMQYIKDWDCDKCRVVLDRSAEDLPPCLIPEPIPGSDTDIFDQDQFVLHEIQFTGYSIISDGRFKMEGKMRVNQDEKKLIVMVKCAGIETIDRNFIRIVPDNNGKTITVFVKFERAKDSAPDGYSEAINNYKYGLGDYTASLPDPMRYALPTSVEELYKCVKAENGVIIITLSLSVTDTDRVLYTAYQ